MSASPQPANPQSDIRIVDAPASSTVKLGDLLREARETQGVSLQDAGAALRIKPNILAALEQGRYDDLPTSAIARGFLRSYAQFLGFDKQTEKLLNLYTQETTGINDRPQLSMPTPLPEGKLPTARLISAALGVAIVLYLVWFTMNSSERPPLEPPIAAPSPLETKTETAPVSSIEPPPAPEAQPVEAATPVAPAPAPVETSAPVATLAPTATATTAKPVATPVVPSAPAQPAAASATSPTSSSVRLRIIADSWVQIQDASGATVFSRLLHAGDVYAVPDQKGLYLTTGNGAGVVIVRDGVESKPLGERAQVVRGMRLTSSGGSNAPATQPTAPQPTVVDVPQSAPVATGADGRDVTSDDEE